jgi:hypothetical protein
MTRHLLIVSSRALPGREAEYERWYEEVHVGEVLALPGFLACERFERLGDGEATEFVALYEVETDDPAALLESLFAAVPKMRLTDAIDPASARFEFLRSRSSGPRAAARP